MKKPLISIVVPVYNVENYLRDCLDSVCAQTLTDWEMILVDDGSTDGSGDICDEYAASDSRIRVVHKENTGQADSRNIAISMAQADYIGFVDSDDWIEPQMYETLYRVMVENDADISICSYFFNYVNREKAYSFSGETLIMSGNEAMEEILEDKRLHSYLWDKLFKKEMICEPLPKSYFYEDHSTLFKWFVNAKK
ncbi:MAG: glycosyltransferase family 2 protein, partial [Candidatus Cryptobacteroides sp.]